MTALVGHVAQVAAFRDAATGGRLHHGWLLAGPKGVGKARFAEMAALRLLAEAAGPPPGDGAAVDPAHPIARLFAAGSHPDFRRLERLPRDPKARERPRDDWEGEELSRNISVDQVRALQRLFGSTPSLSPRRVVLIDAIDDLERGAANALLKNLEEPPANTVFLLISHAPGRLLPTIRSRCRALRFHALDGDDTAAVIRTQLPDAAADEVEALVGIAEGAPGGALRFAGLDVAAFDTALAGMAASGDPANVARAGLARALSGKAAQPRYEAFLERAPAFLAAIAHRRQGPALAEAIGAWEAARALAASAIPLSLDPQAVAFELGTLVAGLAPKAATAKG